jgi:hypothetical protein
MLIKRLKLFNRKDKVLFEGFKQMLSDFHNPEKLEHLKSKDMQLTLKSFSIQYYMEMNLI